jgi:flagellin-like protein
MKGITPVIAVILLLLITISMVGFAFVWFTRLAQTAQEAVSGQQNATIDPLSKRVTIDNVGGASLTLRNRGTRTVEASELGFYINNSAVTCTGLSPIQPNAIGTCTLSVVCGTGARMRITAPAGPDEVTC